MCESDTKYGHVYPQESTAAVAAEGTKQCMVTLPTHLENEIKLLGFQHVVRDSKVLKQMYFLPHHIFFAQPDRRRDGSCVYGVHFRQPTVEAVSKHLEEESKKSKKSKKSQKTYFEKMIQPCDKYAETTMPMGSEDSHVIKDLSDRVIVNRPYCQDEDIPEDDWNNIVTAKSGFKSNDIKFHTTNEFFNLMNEDWHIYCLKSEPTQQMIEDWQAFEIIHFDKNKETKSELACKNIKDCKIVLTEHWLGRSKFGSGQCLILVVLAKLR